MTRRHIENMVLRFIADDTGDDLEELREQAVIRLPKREYVEVIYRLESHFDCTLDAIADPRHEIDVAAVTDALLERATAGRRGI